MANRTLTDAKIAKNDEFYTQFHDIGKEVNAYLEFNPDVFRGKTILLPCDDPYESNFFKYFSLHFKVFGLKKIIATCYDGSPISNKELSLFNDELPENKTTRKAHKLILTDPPDFNGIDIINLPNIKGILSDKYHVIPLLGNGDFRSNEVKALRDESDFIITNPPFSLFREFLAWIFEANKKFLIIGNLNAITYKEVFPLIKENKLWLGNNYKVNGGAMFYEIPEVIANMEQVREVRINNGGKKVFITRVQGVRWFTNLDHGRRHDPLPLMTMADNIRYSKHKEIRGKEYQKYHNYDAIEVPYVDAIPSDYKGLMGVPVSVLDKYSPEQFDIMGTSDNGIIDEKYKTTQGLTQKFVGDYYKAGGRGAYHEGNPTAGVYIDGVATMIYKRIFIRHKKGKK
jgi:hypothetical protein